MISGTWVRLDIDPANARFPAAARVGGKSIWVFRTEHGYRGVQDMCPHAFRSFDNATIVDGTKLRCTYHDYTFTLENGKGVNCPDSIDVYNVVERDGALFAQGPTR